MIRWAKRGMGMSDKTLQGFAAVVLIAIVLFTGIGAFGGVLS